MRRDLSIFKDIFRGIKTILTGIFILFIGMTLMTWFFTGEQPSSQIQRISRMFEQSNIQKPTFVSMENPTVYDTISHDPLFVWEQKKYPSLFINKKLRGFPFGESWVLVDTSGDYEEYLNLRSTFPSKENLVKIIK